MPSKTTEHAGPAATEQIDLKEAQVVHSEQRRERASTTNKILAVICVVALCVVIPYIWYACQISEYALSSGKLPDGHDFPTYSSYSLSFFSAIFFNISKRANKKLIRPCLQSLVPTVDSNGVTATTEARIEALDRMTDHIFYITFYFCMSATNWYICKDQEWFPWYMGGSGTLEASLVNLPFYPTDRRVTQFAQVTLGYYLDELTSLLLAEKRENDFTEMFLHDLVTMTLIFTSLMGNIMPCGTVCILAHDCTDLPLRVSKFVNQLGGHDVLLAISFFFANVMWVWFRLFAFFMGIWSLSTGAEYLTTPQFNPFVVLKTIFLCTLFSLNVFWYTLFQRINKKIIAGIREKMAGPSKGASSEPEKAHTAPKSAKSTNSAI